MNTPSVWVENRNTCLQDPTQKNFSGPCEEVTGGNKTKTQTSVFREVLSNTSPEMHTVEC